MSRILVVRLDGIGDALVLTPLVAALRAAGHELGGVFTTRNCDALAPRAFEERYALERIPWPKHGSTPQTYGPALERARRARYDVALIASEEPEAYRFARAAGIARRIGFWNGWERPLKSLWVRAQCTAVRRRPAAAQRAGRHEVETLFALGNGLHSEKTPTRDLGRLAPLVIEGAYARDGAVALQLSAKLAAYCERAQLDALCAVLAAHGPLDLFVSHAERDAFSPLAAGPARMRVFTELEPWKAAIARARVLITPDTGAAHVAGMLGTPVIDIFPAAPTLRRDAARWRPWAARHRAVAADGAGGLTSQIMSALHELEAAE